MGDSPGSGRDRGHTLQFNGDGRRQAVDFDGGSARLGRWVRKVLRVYAIERFEIAVHVDQKYRDVEQFLPAAPVCIQNGFDIGKNTVDLDFKIEFNKVAIVIECEAGHPTVVAVASRDARPDTAQKEQVAGFTSKGVGPNGLWSLVCVIRHVTKILRWAGLWYLRFMRYQSLPADLYKNNRANFMAQMKPRSIAVFFSNDIYPTSADGTLPFKQASDILWLTGVDQEDTVLVLFPDAHNANDREILFTLETNEELAIWEGAKLDKAQSTTATGIANIQWTTAFERTFHRLMAEADALYLNDNPHTRARNIVETRTDRENAVLRAKYPNYEFERSAPILYGLRAIKSQEEVDQMQRACDITKAGFERVLQFVKPGVMEYEIEAEFMHEFLRRGSRGFAYTPIIGSGFNACVLHYIENSAECKAGDVILMDVGAEYGNYAADMTRCVPVSGKFTDRQRAVYNAVLNVMRGAMNLLKPGVSLHDYHVQVGELMTKELLSLGLITAAEVANQDPAWPAYKKYFMHGTSHFIGLDVHDVGHWHEPIRTGHVFTVEPGIYVREENLGIRLENDVLITDDGNVDLMAHIPVEADDIEAMMA